MACDTFNAQTHHSVTETFSLTQGLSPSVVLHLALRSSVSFNIKTSLAQCITLITVSKLGVWACYSSLRKIICWNDCNGESFQIRLRQCALEHMSAWEMTMTPSSNPGGVDADTQNTHKFRASGSLWRSWCIFHWIQVMLFFSVGAHYSQPPSWLRESERKVGSAAEFLPERRVLMLICWRQNHGRYAVNSIREYWGIRSGKAEKSHVCYISRSEHSYVVNAYSHTLSMEQMLTNEVCGDADS